MISHVMIHTCFPMWFLHVFISKHLIFSNDWFISTFSAYGFIFHSWSYIIPMMSYVKFKYAISGHNMLKCTFTCFFFTWSHITLIWKNIWVHVDFLKDIYLKSNKIQNLPISKPNLNFSYKLSLISIYKCENMVLRKNSCTVPI